MVQPELELKNVKFQDLQTVAGLQRLDQNFLEYLQQRNSDLFQKLLAYRAGSIQAPIEISHFILECGPILEAFIVELFGIEEARIRGN